MIQSTCRKCLSAITRCSTWPSTIEGNGVTISEDAVLVNDGDGHERMHGRPLHLWVDDMAVTFAQRNQKETGASAFTPKAYLSKPESVSHSVKRCGQREAAVGLASAL